MIKDIDVTIKPIPYSFSFSEKGFGFGEFRFYYDEDGKLILDSEAMGRERIKKYLCALVDQAELKY